MRDIGTEGISKILGKLKQRDEVDIVVPNDTYTDIKKEVEAAELNRLLTENDLLRETLEGNKQDREQRKCFSDRVFTLTCIYLLVVTVILVASGKSNNFYLSHNVLIALLTTTTANILGLLLIVVKYLFAKNS